MVKNEKEISNVELVWGTEFLDPGFTTIPNIVSRYAPRLLTGKEFTFIVVLSSFKHSNDYPYPSQSLLAEIMGYKDTRSIRDLIEGLEKKGYIEIEYIYKNGKRYRAVYIFKKLLDACLSLYRKEQMQRDIKNNVKRVKKVSKKITLPEENTPVVPGDFPPVGQEENTPDNNITNQYNNIKITINHLAISDTLKSFLMKDHLIDRLTVHKLKVIEIIFNEFAQEIHQLTFKSIISKCIRENKNELAFESYVRKSLNNVVLEQVNNNTSDYGNKKEQEKTSFNIKTIENYYTTLKTYFNVNRPYQYHVDQYIEHLKEQEEVPLQLINNLLEFKKGLDQNETEAAKRRKSMLDLLN